MNKNVLQVPLKASPEQCASLRALQQAFADVCNVLSPVAARTRCWNRVALHHMTYRGLRERFPQLGSQMVCNAIYSVSRTCRRVYQSPDSPFNLARLGDRPLPLIRFASTSPVYFDRHTLSIRKGHLSLFTLDGRMRFDIELPLEVEQRFRSRKLQEIVLLSLRDEFRLTFEFEQDTEAENETGAGVAAVAVQAVKQARSTREAAAGGVPEYVMVMPETDMAPTGNFA